MLSLRKHSTENPCTYFKTALSLTCENISQTVACQLGGAKNNLLIIYNPRHEKGNVFRIYKNNLGAEHHCDNHVLFCFG